MTLILNYLYLILILLMKNLKILQHNSLLTQTIIQKIKGLTFNPFSSPHNRGREYLTLTSDIDPDNKYFQEIVWIIDDCDYYDEDSFQDLVRSYVGVKFSIFHQNIGSLVNKHDDL